MVFSSSRFDHITPLLRQLHWLKVPERIDYKLALLVYKCLQDVAPSYLADNLCRTADVEARHRLRSASSPSLVVRPTRLSTYGDRAFPVAASRVWNSLPHHVTSAQSLPVFCSHLKTHLFSRSFRWLYCCACEVTLVITDTLIAVLIHLLTYLLTYLFSRVTLPLHQHIRPFTTNEALSPRDEALSPPVSPSPGRGWSAPALNVVYSCMTYSFARCSVNLWKQSHSWEEKCPGSSDMSTQ